MKNTILIILFMFLGRVNSAQTDSFNNDIPKFTKMLVGEDYLYALDQNGYFYVWNLNTLEKKIERKDTTLKFTSIARDKNNVIYLGSDNGKIVSLNKSDFSTKIFIELKKKLIVNEIFFNSKNEIFLIVPYAVYDPIKDIFWTNFKHEPNGMIVQKRFLFFFKMQTDRYFDLPQYSYIDSKDRIWMTKNFGEFGGSIQIFDTKARTELNTNIDSLDFGMFFPQSVFEDNQQNLYITSGLQHFMNSGDIYKIRNNISSKIFCSDDFINTTNANDFSEGVFIGPGAYSYVDNKIYFATNDGFYCSAIPTTGRIEKPEMIFKPELLWNREPLAIGVSMSVKKLEFTTDNRLVFLTSNNGIGIYDGKELKMIK
jgi:outer membrane protein assembly factor BamB